MVAPTTIVPPLPPVQGQKPRNPSKFLRNIVQIDFPAPHFGRIGKLPVFYYDATSMTAAFTAATKEVRALLPDPNMHPIEIRPGRSVAIVSAFEYRDSDIDPYNEVSIAFLTSYGRRKLPGVELLRGLMTRTFEAYVWQLPVTTEYARWGGVELYGYPKFLADIDFIHTPQNLTCRLSVDGVDILSLEGKKLKTAQHSKPLRYKAYSMKAGQPLCANIYCNPQQYGQSMSPKAATLTLGDHMISRQLRALDLASSSLLYQYCPLNETVLFAGRNLMDD